MDTAIPASSVVTAAKEKRERLRKTASVGDDYISLSLTKRDDYSNGPHPESRLVREEDELGEGDDGEPIRRVVEKLPTHSVYVEYSEYTSAQERIALGKKSRKVEALKRREDMSELIHDA